MGNGFQVTILYLESCPKKVDIVKELDSLPETRTSRVTLIPLLMLILIIILILITLGVVANS